jgi:glycosyltransferase involved in cell wall biosynthesis
MREVGSLRRILRDFDPDIVHLHSSKAGLVGRLAVRGRHPTLFQPNAWSFHASRGPMLSAAVAWERVAAPWASSIICVCRAERAEGEARGIRGRWTIVPNGVDVGHFSFASDSDRVAARRRLGVDPRAAAVVTVSRLSRQKGLDVIIRAWRQVLARAPQAVLLIVGEGPERLGLERQTDALRLSNVVFVGERNDVWEWLAAADVVAIASRWEGLSLGMLEAMARGRSIVSTEVSGAREALGSEAGKVVPIEDPDGLASALIDRLLDPELAAREGRAGRYRAETMFELQKTLDQMADVYLQVLEVERARASRRTRARCPS